MFMYVPVFWSGMSEAISNQIMVYMVMSFFWAVQTVKYLSHIHLFCTKNMQIKFNIPQEEQLNS